MQIGQFEWFYPCMHSYTLVFPVITRNIIFYIMKEKKVFRKKKPDISLILQIPYYA